MKNRSATTPASSASLTEAEEKRYAELQLLALGFARHGETDTLKSMLRAGLAVNLEDAKSNTLLMLAAYNGHEETARMLLDLGADVDRRNRHGQTPLGGVAFKGDVRMAEILLEAGADINADNGGGMTPLMYAEMFGRWPVAEFLRKHGAGHTRRTLRSTAMQALALVWRAGLRLIALTKSLSPRPPKEAPAPKTI